MNNTARAAHVSSVIGELDAALVHYNGRRQQVNDPVFGKPVIQQKARKRLEDAYEAGRVINPDALEPRQRDELGHSLRAVADVLQPAPKVAP